MTNVVKFKKDVAANNVNTMGLDPSERYFTYNNQGQLRFDHHLVKDDILFDQPIYRSDIGIVRYDNGVYKRSTSGDIYHIIQQKIGIEATSHRKREILDLILHQNEMKPLSCFNKGIKILNVKNGIYNLTMKQFQKHNKGYFWTLQLPIEYDPEAQCPAILGFLHDLFDEDGVRLVIEWLAYASLSFADPDKILFLLGSGGDGKSTLLNIFKSFLGTDNTSSMSLDDLTTDKFSMAHLYGKLANICGDISSKVIENTGIVKTLTGGEELYAQFKGVDGFMFQSFAKLIFSANELPPTSDKTNGFYRRIFILPFEKKIPEEKKVSRAVLDKRLTTPKELSGLLNLVIEAIHRLKENDYKPTMTDSVRKSIEAYKLSQDKVAQFINEEFELDHGKKVEMKHFYAAYQNWCTDSGVKSEAKRKISEKLQNDGYTVAKGTANKTWVFGLNFLKNSDYYMEN